MSAYQAIHDGRQVGLAARAGSTGPWHAYVEGWTPDTAGLTVLVDEDAKGYRTRELAARRAVAVWRDIHEPHRPSS